MGNFDDLDHNGTVLVPKQCLYLKVPMAMENLNMESLCGAINALGFTGRRMTRVHAPPYRADIGNLGNFEDVDHNGTVFAAKQC